MLLYSQNLLICVIFGKPSIFGLLYIRNGISTSKVHGCSLTCVVFSVVPLSGVTLWCHSLVWLSKNWWNIIAQRAHVGTNNHKFQIWLGPLSSHIKTSWIWREATSWQPSQSCQGSGWLISCSSQPMWPWRDSKASSIWLTRTETLALTERGFQLCG